MNHSILGLERTFKGHLVYLLILSNKNYYISLILICTSSSYFNISWIMMHLRISGILDLMKYIRIVTFLLEFKTSAYITLLILPPLGQPFPLYSLYPNLAQFRYLFQHICSVPFIHSDLFILSIVIIDCIIHLITELLFISILLLNCAFYVFWSHKLLESRERLLYFFDKVL